MDNKFLLGLFYFLIGMGIFSIPVIFISRAIKRVNSSLGPKITPKDELVANEIKKNDPMFDIMSFKISALLCIKEVFNSFYNLDYEKLRVLESSDLYEMHKIDLDTSLISGYFFSLELPKDMNFNLDNYYIDGDKEIICCSAIIGSKKFIFDPHTKEKLINNDSEHLIQNMKLEFSRGIGVKTVLGNEFTIKQCPNCGASISLNLQGECSYCRTNIVNGNHSWVLNKISDWYTH